MLLEILKDKSRTAKSIKFNYVNRRLRNKEKKNEIYQGE